MIPVQTNQCESQHVATEHYALLLCKKIHNTIEIKFQKSQTTINT